jgi:hypothetical protein
VSEVIRYTKIIRTSAGGSAFEEAEVVLADQPVADGVPSMLVGAMASPAAVTFLRSAEFASEPHPAPREQWVVMLRGAIEVEVSDGARQRFGPGDLIFVEDTTGSGHVTTSIGDPPHEALFLAPTNAG